MWLLQQSTEGWIQHMVKMLVTMSVLSDCFQDKPDREPQSWLANYKWFHSFIHLDWLGGWQQQHGLHGDWCLWEELDNNNVLHKELLLFFDTSLFLFKLFIIKLKSKPCCRLQNGQKYVLQVSEHHLNTIVTNKWHQNCLPYLVIHTYIWHEQQQPLCSIAVSCWY